MLCPDKQPFSTTNFKPIESLRDFVGNGFSGGTSGGSALSITDDDEDVSSGDEYDYDDGDDKGFYAGFKLDSDEGDYDDGGGDKNVRYDYMYEVRTEEKAF